MRTIKFRMWDEATQTMIDGDSLAFEEYAPITDLLSQDGVMQWTGLYDKNGREIYESDILTTDHYPHIDEGKQNYVEIVEWDAPSFYGVKRCVNPEKRGISDGIGEILEEADRFEVIGNIYEHSELLKEGAAI